MTERGTTIAYCHACGAPMDVSSVAPFTNVECPKCGKHTRVKREFGPYTLVRRHAIGGMSMVFSAHDNTLNREVALKILSEDFSADEKRIAAFEEEARITASFSHPNIVRVLTTGRAFGRFYIAMEFVPGGHFEHQIRERGKIPEAEVLALAIEVAHGLKAAHAAGLIHRDVKPGNILLDAEGRPKLVDFGLALVTQGGTAKATEFWATPYYVPPETVEGKHEDFRSDVYAFGATLYHALAGKPPCNEESMATDVLLEAKKKVMPLHQVEPSISADTCHIVDKAMAYRPEDRFASYDDLISSLETALSHVRSGRGEAVGAAAKRRAAKKRKERILLIGAAAVAVAIGGIVAWATMREEPVVAKPAPAPEPVVVPDEASLVLQDTSVDIVKSYREARSAVEGKDFEKAAALFVVLHENPEVQEPTRTWAGVEAVVALFLDGRPADARKRAQTVLEHVRALSTDQPPVGEGLLRTLGQLSSMPAVGIPKPGPSTSWASRVVACMLAGLKNWEQGMTESAAAGFKEAVSISLPADEQWAAIYQEVAKDYLDDFALISGPLFAGYPNDKAGCESAIDELNSVLARLKTRGRARFNVRAWQLDLARHAKLLEARKAVAPEPKAPEKPAPDFPAMLANVTDRARDYRFNEAVAYLESLPEAAHGDGRDALLALAGLAGVFLNDLSGDLAKESVTANLTLRSGETVSKLSANAGGAITAVTSGGKTIACQWSDFPPDALISLHRILVRNPVSEEERLRRHECAIAFDWLAGDRERAVAAAAALSQGSTAFKQRWDALLAGLQK